MTFSLLPCPFCGQAASFSSRYVGTVGGDGCRCYVAECDNDYCWVCPAVRVSGPNGYPHCSGPDQMKSDEEAEREAVRRWNHRVE